MTQPNASGQENIEAKLPRRDWILLPLLSLLTIGLLAASTELIARQIFTEWQTREDDCLLHNDPSTGWRGIPNRGIPNCVFWAKGYEGEPVEFRFNSSGYRAGAEFVPKQPDTYRIVMVGSSVAEGAAVQRERTFATLLPAELSKQTGRKVELYNEGMSGRSPQNVALRFNEVLAVQPDAILWILTPHDFEIVGLQPEPQLLDETTTAGRAIYRVKQALTGNSLPDAIADIWSSIEKSFVSRFVSRWEDTASGVLVQHYLYQNRSNYVKLWLKGGAQAEFLMAKPNSEWQDHLEQFNRYAGEVEGRAKAAGVPLVAVLVPNRAQAAMISMGEWPVGYDPYKLDDELRPIIVSHGGIYIDILPDYRNTPNSELGYLLVDGHPNADGNAMISRFLAKELTSGAVPALRVAAQSQAVMKGSR